MKITLVKTTILFIICFSISASDSDAESIPKRLKILSEKKVELIPGTINPGVEFLITQYEKKALLAQKGLSVPQLHLWNGARATGKKTHIGLLTYKIAAKLIKLDLSSLKDIPGCIAEIATRLQKFEPSDTRPVIISILDTGFCVVTKQTTLFNDIRTLIEGKNILAIFISPPIDKTKSAFRSFDGVARFDLPTEKEIVAVVHQKFPETKLSFIDIKKILLGHYMKDIIRICDESHTRAIIDNREVTLDDITVSAESRKVPESYSQDTKVPDYLYT